MCRPPTRPNSRNPPAAWAAWIFSGYSPRPSRMAIASRSVLAVTVPLLRSPVVAIASYENSAIVMPRSVDRQNLFHAAVRPHDRQPAVPLAAQPDPQFRVRQGAVPRRVARRPAAAVAVHHRHVGPQPRPHGDQL